MKALVLVLVLLTACSRSPRIAVAVERVDSLPPIPVSFPTQLGPIPVVWWDSIPEAAPGYTTLGRFHPMRREIWMWRGVISRAEQWRVVLHEYCHVLHWDRGIRTPDETIEKMCEVFAFALAPIVLDKQDKR